MEEKDKKYFERYFEKKEKEGKEIKERYQIKTTPEEAFKYAKENAPFECPDILEYPNPLPEKVIPIETPNELPKTLRETIIGILMGQAVGDCIGVHGEGRTKKEVEYLYKDKELTMKTSVITRGTIRFMNDKYELDDWTDDTDQCLLILDSLVRNNGNVNILDFAKRMKWWKFFGFSEMGDLCGLGYGSTFNNATRHPNFLIDPITSTKELMENGIISRSTDGSVMRTSVASIPYFWNEEKVIENAHLFGIVTHPTLECQVSVTIVVLILAKLLQGREDVSTIIEESYQRGLKDCENNDEIITLVNNHVNFSQLSELTLEKNMSHTMKPMACAIHSLRNAFEMKKQGIDKREIFKKCIVDIIMEGGDADTNCAVAGAVLGGYLKDNCIPNEWLELRHLTWYQDRINRILDLYQLNHI